MYEPSKTPLLDQIRIPEDLRNFDPDRLRQIVAGGGRVWLYDGFGVKISKILKEKLDAAFPPPKEHALEGPYHKRILEYGGTKPVQPESVK